MNDIFEVDFFDDDIVEEDVDTYNSYDDAYEDVDVFDEDYFEAMEGNKENKFAIKNYQYAESLKMPLDKDTEDNYKNRMKLYRKTNHCDVKSYRRHRDRQFDELEREDLLTNNADNGEGRSKKYNQKAFNNMIDAYKDSVNVAKRQQIVADNNPSLISKKTRKTMVNNVTRNYHNKINPKPTQEQRDKYIKYINEEIERKKKMSK